MATEGANPGACTACGKTATTHCAGCFAGSPLDDRRTPTSYCSKECQSADWNSHKKVCLPAQAKHKLSRAGELLQQTFLSTRAEVFDLCIERIERASDGKIHFFDTPNTSELFETGPFPASVTDVPPEIKDAVLSYCAGGDVTTGLMFELIQKALQGSVKKFEELHVRKFDSHVRLIRHTSPNSHSGIVSNHHYIVRVTLKDDSIWAMDIAGAQHDQRKAILLFAEYSRDYIAKILDSRCRPWGTLEMQPQHPVVQRHPDDGFSVAFQVSVNQEYQINELCEWEFLNVNVDQLLKMKPAAEFQRLKGLLIDHITTAACKNTTWNKMDPTSKARELVRSGIFAQPLSKEDKTTSDRQIARKTTRMDAGTRKRMMEMMARGGEADDVVKEVSALLHLHNA